MVELVIGLVLGAIAASIYWVREIERLEWHGGICRDTGKPWEHFDTDSQGGRGYKSDGHYMWLSWGFDKKRFHH